MCDAGGEASAHPGVSGAVVALTPVRNAWLCGSMRAMMLWSVRKST